MNLSLHKVFNLMLLSLCLFLFALLAIRGCQKCPPNPEYITQIIHDTIPADTHPIELKVPYPQPKYTRKKKEDEPYTLIIEDSSYITSNAKPNDHSKTYKNTFPACTDTAFYMDTVTSKDNWKLILFETVANNRIIERKPFVQDLRPVITTTILKQPAPAKEHIRFYGGLDISINTSQANKWGMGPAGLLTIPQGYAFRYGYDLRNSTHQAGVYFLFSKRR